MHEETFQRNFHRILIEQCGYVLESKSQRNVTSSNYLDKDNGLSYVRIHNDNTVTYSENDIVNNTQSGDYAASNKKREKVQTHIIALDILIDLIIDKLPSEILQIERDSVRKISGSSELSNLSSK